MAADIAREEAIYDARFTLLSNRIKQDMEAKPEFKKYMSDIRTVFQYQQFKRRMGKFGANAEKNSFRILL